MRGSSVSGTRCGHRGQVLVPRKRESLGRSELNVGGSEHCEHGAGFITVVTDGVIGLRLNDDHVARTGGFLSTVDIDCALACNDEQNLFDVVGVCGHGLTAGEVVDEHGDGIRAVRPINKTLESRQPGPTLENRAVFASQDGHETSAFCVCLRRLILSRHGRQDRPLMAAIWARHTAAKGVEGAVCVCPLIAAMGVCPLFGEGSSYETEPGSDAPGHRSAYGHCFRTELQLLRGAIMELRRARAPS